VAALEGNKPPTLVLRQSNLQQGKRELRSFCFQPESDVDNKFVAFPDVEEATKRGASNSCGEFIIEGLYPHRSFSTALRRGVVIIPNVGSFPLLDLLAP
jgi:hypothetical protein